jgi:predicted DNA-binding transcriptional regulator YafY
VAVLLGLVAGRRAGLVTSSATAMESAAAKMRRVLPSTLAARLEALLATANITGASRPVATAETSVLLLLAEAARNGRPVALDYTAWSGRRSERILHPYGIVAHSGRWYVTGADSSSGEVRTFRLDRITSAVVREGSFEAPADFDPAARVLDGLASVPRAYAVSVRVRATVPDIRRRVPASVATVQEDGDWVRMRLRTERLDWVPALLASLDRPFVIESPDELRSHVEALGRRLLAGGYDEDEAQHGGNGLHEQDPPADRHGAEDTRDRDAGEEEHLGREPGVAARD